MPVTYKLMTLPLHSAKPNESPKSFRVRIVSTLEFPGGTTTTADIAAAVGAHPVLGRQADQPIESFAVTFDSWVTAGRPATATSGIPVTLTYTPFTS